MKKFTVAIIALAAVPGLAFASVQGAMGSARPSASISAPIGDAEPASATVRVAVAPTTIAAGEALPEHSNATERYIYVVSGRVRVSNLVTGVDQDVSPGEMAVETQGHIHVARALDGLPASVLLIDWSSLGLQQR